MIRKLQEGLAEDLCAQQVITNVTDSIKELVDNSVDAGATRIQIMLEDYGKKAIQVHDNGCGISNLQYIGQKGTTSKNQSKTTQIKTLGFRGQALHSLAKVSQQLTIQTQTANNPQTLHLNLKTGNQHSIHPQRSVGTTIRIQSLFEYLPVRRYELMNRFKDYMRKTDVLIKEYALVFPEIVFMLKNVRSQRVEVLVETSRFGGKKETVWRNRVVEVLGTKYGDKIVYIETELVEGWLLNKIQSGSSNQNSFIRRNQHYMYLNKRPIDPLPKLLETLNSFYKKYKKNTKYFFILNLKLDWSTHDINLAPNKREILVNQKVVGRVCEQIGKFVAERVVEDIADLRDLKDYGKSRNIGEFVGKRVNQDEIDGQKGEQNGSIQEDIDCPQQQIILKIQQKQQIKQSTQSRQQPTQFRQQQIIKQSTQPKTQFRQQKIIKEQKSPIKIPNKNQYNKTEHRIQQQRNPYKKQQIITKTKQKKGVCNSRETFAHNFRQALKDRVSNARQPKNQKNNNQIKKQNNIYPFQPTQKLQLLNNPNPQQPKYPTKQNPPKNILSPPSVQTDLGQWIQKRTNHSLHKQNFQAFKILGQFNLGFIVCLYNNKYYLVDQHAASEKYHFEKLLTSGRQSIQAYQHLSLTPLERESLQEYGSQIRNDGYDFQWQNGDTLLLTRVPIFLGKIYGAEYFREMLDSYFVLKDHRDYYQAAATKACRVAVMVGHVLNKQQMEDIVKQLSQLESPWNCPHGRPTLIYLGNQFQFMSQCQPSKQFYDTLD